MPEITQARFITKAIIAAIVRGLRSGKSPKEIAAITGESAKYVEMLLMRYPEVHAIFVETYFLRHPTKSNLPPRWKAAAA